MAFLYVALGMILGGITTVIMMAMLFVAKRAEEDQNQMRIRTVYGKNQQEIQSRSCEL